MSLQSRFFNNPSRDLDNALQTGTSSSSPRTSSTGVVTSTALKSSTPEIVADKPVALSSDKTDSSADKGTSSSRLTVGPNIKLKGVEITDCDTLVVEGSVQASMDSRVMQIAEGGSFSGSAQIDHAEIRGEFEGELTARHKLTLFSTARVKGQIRYGKLVMEEGAQLTGDVAFGASGSTSTSATTQAASNSTSNNASFMLKAA
jgi:cytoskeletal protein CcmA (bactofilin family)